MFEKILNNLKGVLRAAGFVFLVAWAAAMTISSTIFVLGFPIPEIMVSPSFLGGGCGFLVLYDSFIHSQRKMKGKAGLTILLLHLTIGGLVLFTACM